MLDDLERALDAAEHHEEAKVLEGVRMTKEAAAVLARGRGGDPGRRAVRPGHVHEALMTQPAEESSPHVAQVVTRATGSATSCLRPARVVVAED